MNEHNYVTHALDYIPFVGLATRQAGQATPVITRLMEAAVIAGITLYGTVSILQTDMRWLKQSMVEMRQDFKEVQSQVHDIETRQIRIITKQDGDERKRNEQLGPSR